MLKLIQVILTLLTIVVVNGVIFTLQYKGNMKHPDFTNQCYYPEHNLSIPINETIYPTNLKNACIKVFCREDYVLEIRHCFLPGRNNVCSNTAYDYTKPYPACCPIINCDGNVYPQADD